MSPSVAPRLFERPAEGLVWRGDDRRRFLGGLVSCEVKSLEPGRGTYGFFTEIKGHILADVTVLALEDRLWLELPPGRAAAIEAHAAKYRIVDRVDFAPLTERSVTLVGDEVGDWLGFAPIEPWSHIAGAVDGLPVRAVRDARFGDRAVTLWAPPASLDRLLASLRARGAVGMTADQAEVARIERGWPRFGVDYGEQSFPQETGLGDLAISYTKGCFLGQEIVARIHYRGGVQRRLCGLRLHGEWAVGMPLRFEGREVGTLTSATVSSLLGDIGLAVLHKRAETGSRVEVGDNGVGDVVALPW